MYWKIKELPTEVFKKAENSAVHLLDKLKTAHNNKYKRVVLGFHIVKLFIHRIAMLAFC